MLKIDFLGDNIKKNEKQKWLYKPPKELNVINMF